MAKYPGGVVVSGYISPSDTSDQYATHRADLGKGGYRSVLKLTDRDSITNLRREIGMVVFVIEENKEYRLVGGITNENWEEVIGGSGSAGDSNYLITTDIFTRDEIDTAKRKIGQIVYVLDENKEYRLVGGITNENWEELTAGGIGVNDCCNYIIVNNLTDIENYPVEKRFIGLTLYAKDADKEFRFVGGLENSNLKEINSTVVNYNPDGTLTVIQPGENGGGSSTTIGENITQIGIINNYYNKIGCLNKSLITNILFGIGSEVKPIYKEEGKIIISNSDKNEFSFRINGSEFWSEDWVYFTGTSEVILGSICETYFEYISNGKTIIYNIEELLNPNSTIPEDFILFGNISSWFGYFKDSTVGRKEIKVYQIIDNVKKGIINKTIYFFAPNFAIFDGSSPTPQKIILNNSSVGKDYSVKVLSNTNLNINLAKVNTTQFGIDTKNYKIIQNTLQSITIDSTYTIPIETLKSLPDGTYSLIVTGSDNGIPIPPYFYGPFSIENLVFSSITPTS